MVLHQLRKALNATNAFEALLVPVTTKTIEVTSEPVADTSAPQA
jgi:hypothetical protein